MAQGHNINSEKAFIAGRWTDDIRDALLQYQPSRMELSGDWSDLSMFAGAVDSIQGLKISGSLERGEIKALGGIEVFSSLRRLSLVSKVKSGLHPLPLPLLESLDAKWQKGLMDTIDQLPRLRTLVIGGYAGESLSALPNKSTIEYLWLSNPAIASMNGIAAFSALNELRVTDAKKLTSLSGIEATRIKKLDIEGARQLIDLLPIGSAQTLEWIRLLFISEQANTAQLYELQNLRSLHIGGKGVPLIDWFAAMLMPRIEAVFGWWDPSLISEEAIRSAVRPGRCITKFEHLSQAKVRPLDIALADVG
ncbi:hypothetical protein [Chitinimonas lacunae]|uniref:Leucine-rich repeat domain-containing protein n=1 Tax=Chitinimonas lacunae TaxID=1963018 RepID=A0ABV8MUX1_9NEIS